MDKDRVFKLYSKLNSYAAVARIMNTTRQRIHQIITNYKSPRQRNNIKNASWAREYRKSIQGKEAVNAAVKKYREKNSTRVSAWQEARKSLPLMPCEICSDPKGMRHHPDISKPLEVIYLCAKHHKEASHS